REAVRQPPDPRLEKSFAKLGLWSEAPSDEAADAPARHGDAPSPPSPAAPDHEDLRSSLSEVRAAVEELRASVDATSSRAELATRLRYISVGLLAVIVALSVLVLLRPGG